jgi:hypothetical protein
MKNKFAILFLLFTLSVLSCDPVDNITIVNESSRVILFQYSLNGIFPEKSPYRENIKINELSDLVMPNSETRMEIISSWENYIRKDFTNETFYLYLFDLDTLKKHPWEQVKVSGNYLYKFEIPVDTLKALNWRIVYHEKLMRDDER